MKNRFRIVVATDYSAASLVAENYAVNFAISTNSEITFLHVYEAPLNVTSIERVDFIEKSTEFESAELKLLELHCQMVMGEVARADEILPYHFRVREGNAAQMICMEAKESGADFIFIGTHGISGFSDVVLGSHTWNVIKNASVPVLAIPEKGVYHDIKHLAFASGEREGELPALKYLTNIAKGFDADVMVLHISNYAISKGFEATMFKKFREEIQDKITYPKIHLRLEFNERVLDGIHLYCSRENPDWLVMSHEKTSLIEDILLPTPSFTKKMSFRTLVPLLCIPDYYNPDYSDFWRLFEPDEKMLNDDF